MGYTTDFEGEFNISPALTAAQVEYLQAFAQTRRMGRDASIAQTLPDPARVAVGLPVGVDGAYFVGGTGDFGQDSDTSVRTSNSPPQGQPGLWCQWTVSDCGTALHWDGGEKFYYYEEWLAYIVEHFLNPWNCTLSGEVQWQGEEDDDVGVLAMDNQKVLAFYGEEGLRDYKHYLNEQQNARITKEVAGAVDEKTTTVKGLKL